MGWRGTIRSIKAASRRAEREAQRQQRELQKQAREYEKMKALEQAEYEVSLYQNKIDLLQSVHKEWGELLDWEAISKLPEPMEPQNLRKREKEYKAGFFSKIFGLAKKGKEKAIQEDINEFKKNYQQWEENHKDWKENKTLADAILAHDDDARIEVIGKVNPFSDITELGTTINFRAEGNEVIEATLSTYGKNQIPTEIKSLLRSGKLSTKKMPKGMFNELYQDYVCSCALRIGNELLAILADDIVLVHVYDNILNTATGHMEEECILSIAISRDTISKMNMDLIDPSDSLDNFVHNMNFKKTTGFKKVEKLDSQNFKP